MSTTVKESMYKLNVLQANQNIKLELNSLNGAAKCIISFAKTDEGKKLVSDKYVNYLQEMKKDAKLYKALVNDCRKTKKGTYPMFYVLQSLYRLIDKE